MSFLENLPLELLLMIINDNQIRRQDLKALRATSRTFSFLTSHLFATLSISEYEYWVKGRWRKLLANPEIRRSVKELAIDMGSLQPLEVINLVKRVAALFATYNDLVIEKIRVNQISWEHMVQCFRRLQKAGVTSIQSILITASQPLPIDFFNNVRNMDYMKELFQGIHWQALTVDLLRDYPVQNIYMLPKLQVTINLSCPTINLRRLRLLRHPLTKGFLDSLQFMPYIEEVTLIDISLHSRRWKIQFEINDQRCRWYGFAESFDKSYGSQKRLLIGVTKGSDCQGSHVDYSMFKSVRKLTEDEVLNIPTIYDILPSEENLK
ncbi:hypothetical protein V8E54_001153 [Elaphomyces granulatus]